MSDSTSLDAINTQSDKIKEIIFKLSKPAYVKLYLKDQNEKINSNLNSLVNKNIAAPNNDVGMELVPKAAIDTKTMNETATLSKDIFPISISNVNEETKNNNEAITPTQVQYSNIDTEEEERSIYIANLEIDGAKFREISRKITTLFKRNKPENDKYK